MDPIIVALVVALATGVTQGVTAVGAQMIVDAYAALVSAIKDRCGADSSVTQALARLEQQPERESRQLELAEEFDRAHLTEDLVLVHLAEGLKDALSRNVAGKEGLGKFTVRAEQIGLVGDHARIDGDIRFGAGREDS